MNPSTRKKWKKANAVCGSRARRDHRPRPLLFFIPLTLSGNRIGLALAVKGTASPRFAPWTAPGRAGVLDLLRGEMGGGPAAPLVETSRHLDSNTVAAAVQPRTKHLLN